jgi:hypothetical protein
MGDIRTSAAASFRDFTTDGVPASGIHEPIKSDVRATFGVVEDELEAVQDLAAAGIKWTTNVVAVRSTGNVDIATALENGDTLNGVVLATGQHVFLGSQSTASQNGIYTVPASGAAARATWADTAAELAYLGFLVQGGTVGAGERWMLPLATSAITVGTTALTFAPVGIGLDVPPASNAETLARTKTDAAVTPAGLGHAIEKIIAPLDFALRYGIPNASAKIVCIKAGEYRWLIRTPLKYDAGVNPSNSDFAEYEMQDMGPFQSPTMTRGWALNSVRMMIDGRMIVPANFSFETFSGQTNTQVEPSTFEFAIEMGEGADTVNETNFPFKGFGHGGMEYVTSQFFLDGSVAVDYAVPANAPVGTVIWCDSASFQQSFNIMIGAEVGCRTTLVHDFLSNNASGQCRVEHVHDFTHAAVTATDPSIRTGYAALVPFTGVDFVKATGATAVDIEADVDGNIAHGQKTQLAYYRSTNPTALLEVILAFGFPMRIGATLGTVADDNWTYCDPSQYVVTLRNSGYGGKGYIAFCTQAGGSVTIDNFAGKVVRCQAFYRAKSGTPA